MGSTQGRPSPKEMVELKENYHEYCKKAATALRDGDVLVVVTGAGFSADSGLAVYNDIAKVAAYEKLGMDYMDLCQPYLMESEPELFYGFWGKCFNDYRDRTPHEGYHILKLFKEYYLGEKTPNTEFISEEILSSRRSFSSHFSASFQSCFKRSPGGKVGCFFIHTSNVDSHSEKAGFNEFEVREIHGTLEEWQCSKCGFSWESPREYRFEIDETTMHAPCTPSSYSAIPHKTRCNAYRKMLEEGGVYPRQRIDRNHYEFLSNPENRRFTSTPINKIEDNNNDNDDSNMHDNNDDGGNDNDDEVAEIHDWVDRQIVDIVSGFDTNHPTCWKCGNLARPRILMFGDLEYIDDYDREDHWRNFCTTLYDIVPPYYSSSSSLDIKLGIDYIKSNDDNSNDSNKISESNNEDVNNNDDNNDDNDNNEKMNDENNNKNDEKTVEERRRKVVVLEIGCGLRVPTCRWQTETIARNIGGNCTVIRINPDFPLMCEMKECDFVPIAATGKDALIDIMTYFKELFVSSQNNENND